MSNNKQSSVEWFAKEINELNFWLENHQITNREFNRLKLKVLNKAKAMHEEEIKDAYEEGDADAYWELHGEPRTFKNKHDYYNQTFGDNK